jgi:hypothetical protein
MKNDDLNDLLNQFDYLSLDFGITVLYDGYICHGKNNFEGMQLIIPFRKKRARDFMKLEFLQSNSNKENLIAVFTKLIGYSPFCKYLKEKNVVYEWNKNKSKERFNELTNNKTTDRLEKL